MILLPTKIFNAIDQVMKSRINFDRNNIYMMIHYLNSVKEQDTAKWVAMNKHAYLRGILEGFGVDNSQKQQLKDINTEVKL